MSMHKIPLTEIERSGLQSHGLDIGTPSQLSDVFRQGVRHALAFVGAAPTLSPVAACDRAGGCDCGTPNVCCDHYVEPSTTAAGAAPVPATAPHQAGSTEVLHIPAQWLDAPTGPLLDRLSLAAAGAMLDKGFSGLTRDDLAKCNCSNVGRKVVQVLAKHVRQQAVFHTSPLPSHDSISAP